MGSVKFGNIDNKGKRVASKDNKSNLSVVHSIARGNSNLLGWGVCLKTRFASTILSHFNS